MASQIFRKILSIFYRQPIERGKVHSFRTVNGVFGDWATSTVDDLPPPYTDSPDSKAHSQDKKHVPTLLLASPRLQICPHETLSIEDLQNIAMFLATSKDGETIVAPTPSCHEHHSQLDLITGKAKSVCVSSPGLLRGIGMYALEDTKDSVCLPSVVLYFHWNLGSLAGLRGQVETSTELQHFLGGDGIQLCPHKQISDSDIVNAIFGLVTRQSAQDVTMDCERCETEITVTAIINGNDQLCRVTTRRHLGTVNTPNDPVWLAQCGG